MNNHDEREIIEAAISEIAEMSAQETDGEWLENLTVRVAPLIRDWDVKQAWRWGEWEYGEANLGSGYKRADVGIDAVAMRSDGKYIAIQCKSRMVDGDGRGNPISKDESDSFASASASEFWEESWVVSNCDVGLGSRAAQTASMRGKPVKILNVARDLERERESWASKDDCCVHCENPDDPNAVQSKTCMQNDAVAESVRILREHAGSDSGGSPRGEARGRIILPCGTGKTRISLRIVEELTPPGGVSVVLCPSIALVAQIRREYLQYAAARVDVLAVCSDQTAGYDPKKEGVRNPTQDPTVDNGSVSASEIKGRVTTDADEIAAWMIQPALGGGGGIKVLIGTYQSSVRVSDALLKAGVRASVLIADEAHRTAGLKRRNSASAKARGEEKRVRDFTVCHDGERFPATYRVYQTATPRIYEAGRRATRNPDWIVRSMDDESTFGVELYRKSYYEAVRNGWLSNYRIIALGVNDERAYAEANALARAAQSAGRRRMTTVDYMRGLAFALAMGGATQGGEDEDEDVDIRSCIAFMNTVDKSKNMARDLQTDAVKKWVDGWLKENEVGRGRSDYSLEHLDASSSAAARETAKTRLADADSDKPHGVVNVGIFGEGTDSPSLSAVAFLEARKSPIDVVQAVGRAMRTAPGKDFGYIICPILFPPSADPETWLASESQEQGWQELGQILLALRAHDRDIEENLEDLLYFYMPKPPATERSILAVARAESKTVEYLEYEGPVGAAEEAVERMLKGASRQEVGANRIGEKPPSPYKADEPTQVIAGKKNDDGSSEIRIDAVERDKPKAGEANGKVDIEKTKTKARDKMLNRGVGRVVKPGERSGKRRKKIKPGEDPKPRRTSRQVAEESAQRMLKLSGMGESGAAIKMNLLTKSGLSENRVVRDMNILEESVSEAARHLRDEDLLKTLNVHFGLDRLKTAGGGKKQADGCTVAALLMMNAAMLHQRIANGRWLPGVRDMSQIKNDKDAARTIIRQWNVIMRHDFRPVLEPAVEAIEAVEETGRLAGLERALRHVAAEAERIAETYADMGADHAGPLFNRVMGNQASDGAFFTRPVAASLAARLTLDAVGETDWTSPAAWRELKTVDPACGSGTLLAAILADMKRRAKDAGANEDALAALQKIAVEETVKGLDINPVSLQLAASQLTAGNSRISYRQMGLHLMPYGPDRYDPAKISSGTLELLGQKAIVSRRNQLDLPDDAIASQAVWDPTADAGLENAVEAAKDARIVIMNPPFTNRAKMGEKFPSETKRKLRERADAMETKLLQADPELIGFVDKNSIRPLFVGVADHCMDNSDGILTMINPTIALTAPSGFNERRILARRFHVHTILTCHQPGNINMSQNTAINESVIVMRRHEGPKPPTRFINLDRLPADDEDVGDFHRCLADCEKGLIANGWGEVSHWPSERIEAGDWTPAIWRSPELADAAAKFANDANLQTIADADLTPAQSGRMLTSAYERADNGAIDAIPVIDSKGAKGQTTIESRPDGFWEVKPRNASTYSDPAKLLRHSGHVLITFGQDNRTGRLTAVAGDARYIGNGWMPIRRAAATEAKSLAVFLNSTPGRLQIMRNAGKKLDFPTYAPAAVSFVRIPNIKDARIQKTLADCWERTKDTLVPQFRDGDCEVRRLWDEAVAEAMGWDSEELARQRGLLHREPHVRGLGYNQYGDAAAGSA